MSQDETYSSVLTAECKMRIARLTTISYCPSTQSDDSIDDPFQTSSEYNSNYEDSSNSNSTIDDVELDDNINKKGKRRGRYTRNWSAKKAKLLRNTGKSYVSLAKSKRSFEERKMGQPCGETCRLRCTDQINEAERQKLFDNYWSLGDLQRQREYIAGHMEPIIPKYRYSCTGNFRKHNNAFYFTVNVTKMRVCKLFFMSTLGISDRYIRTTLSKKNSNGFVDPDLRGKHNNHPTVDPEIKDSVREFIKAIPRIESHYLRNQSSREFIEGSKCIAYLYRDYKELRMNDNLPFAHSSMFNKIFNTEFNISFFKPKKDQCDFCETYKNANDQQKLELYEAQKSHQEEKELSRKEKEEDKKKSHVAVYDLQAVLPLPKGLTSSFYYLYARNVECFFWSEIEGNRGSFEIGSCVLHYIESEIQKASNPEDVEFIFYSDNCAGQQKNKYLISMYSYAVQKYHIKSITHKFLITGHSQNEGDNVHSVIEKQIKRHVTCIPIYIPEQYISLIATAKKTGRPYKLHKLSHNDFYDLKTLQEEWGHNFTTNVEKEKFLWKDIKILRVEKNSPESFYYKTSYNDSNYKEVKMMLSAENLRQYCRTCFVKLESIVKDDTKKSIPTDKYPELEHLIQVCLARTTVGDDSLCYYVPFLCRSCFEKWLDFLKLYQLAIKTDEKIRTILEKEVLKTEVNEGEKNLKNNKDFNEYFIDSETLVDIHEIEKYETDSPFFHSNMPMNEIQHKAMSLDVSTQLNTELEPKALNNIELVTKYYEDNDKTDNSLSDNADDVDFTPEIKQNRKGTKTLNSQGDKRSRKSLCTLKKSNKIRKSFQKTNNNQTPPEIQNDISADFEDNGPKKVRYKCEPCNKYFWEKNKYDGHMKQVHEGIRRPYQCLQCNKAYNLYKTLLQHKRECHSEKSQEEFKCEKCDKIFKTAVILKQHMNNKHSEQKDAMRSICDQCGFIAAHQYSLSRHIINKHTETDQIKCDHCPKVFKTQYSLKYHVIGNHNPSNIKPFKCPECQMGFTRKTLLNQHKRTHLKYTERIKCDFEGCEVRFVKHGDKTHHMRLVHLKVKQHVCDFCGEAFGAMQTLRHHRFIHTGEKPYKCNVCGQGFRQRTAMKTHRKTHFGKNTEQHDVINNLPEINLSLANSLNA